MAPTSLNEQPVTLAGADRTALLELARRAIRHGLRGEQLKVDVAQHSPALRAPGASFVTLKIAGELRGCIGSLEHERALAVDVAENAFAAAFRDPRFAALTHREFEIVSIHISLLSTTEPVRFESEADLLRLLRPGIDGIVLQEGHRRATFLPVVWEQLPDPADFLQYLKRKAGLAPDYWSARISIERYTVDSIS